MLAVAVAVGVGGSADESVVRGEGCRLPVCDDVILPPLPPLR